MIEGIDLTPTQKRVAEALVGNPMSIPDICHLIGGAAINRPDIAGSFMKKLSDRFEGSWWSLERVGLQYAVYQRVAHRT